VRACVRACAGALCARTGHQTSAGCLGIKQEGRSYYADGLKMRRAMVLASVVKCMRDNGKEYRVAPGRTGASHRRVEGFLMAFSWREAATKRARSWPRSHRAKKDVVRSLCVDAGNWSRLDRCLSFSFLRLPYPRRGTDILASSARHDAAAAAAAAVG
jgi:hypothetical protein